MRYSRRTSNYPKRITLSNPTRMMSMVDLACIGVETRRIDNGCSLEKEFTELIHMNHWMVLYLIVNHDYSCHGCVCGHLTWDAKYILWMDDCVLIMNYESLDTRYLKRHILDTTWSTRRWLRDQGGIIHPRYLRRLTQGIKYNEILGQDNRNIGGVVDYFWIINSNLSDQLEFDSWSYPKSFMSLVRMKDYRYMKINDKKVP